MGATSYIGVSSKARKVKKMYIGIGGKAREIKKAWIGVGGKARLIYSGLEDWPDSTIIKAGSAYSNTMSTSPYTLIDNSSYGAAPVSYINGKFLTSISLVTGSRGVYQDGNYYTYNVYTGMQGYYYADIASRETTYVTVSFSSDLSYGSNYFTHAGGHQGGSCDKDGSLLFLYMPSNTTINYARFNGSGITLGTWGTNFTYVSGDTSKIGPVYVNGKYYIYVYGSLYYSTAIGSSWTLLKNFKDTSYTGSYAFISFPEKEGFIISIRYYTSSSSGYTYNQRLYKVVDTTVTSWGSGLPLALPANYYDACYLYKFKDKYFLYYRNNKEIDGDPIDWNDMYDYAYTVNNGASWTNMPTIGVLKCNTNRPLCNSTHIVRSFSKKYTSEKRGGLYVSSDGINHSAITFSDTTYSTSNALVGNYYGVAVPGGYVRH